MGKYLINDNVPKYLGSVFTTSGGAAIKPPTGCVFIAITATAAATFDATGGLLAEEQTQWANTADAAGDLADGSETVSEGSGGLQVTNTNLSVPAGTTIYGRYTEIDLAGGTVIAYFASKGAGAAETTTHANYAAAPGK